MEPLLADSAVASYDIIAIQEPWKNPQMNRTYCPAAAGYYSAYDDIEQRCCFIVNKNLDISTWDVEFYRPDLVVLSYRTNEVSL